MKHYEILSYVYDFVSQLLDNTDMLGYIDKIILFGSAARGDFHSGSDVDLFIELKKGVSQKNAGISVKKEINKFELRCEKTWHLRGIDLPLKVIVGSLAQERWADIREEIISHGRILFAEFEQAPKKLSHNILVTYDLKSLKQKNKMAFLRGIYGYASTKNGRTYMQKGMLDKISGRKLGSGAVMVPRQEFGRLKGVLKENGVHYTVLDIWAK